MPSKKPLTTKPIKANPVKKSTKSVITKKVSSKAKAVAEHTRYKFVALAVLSAAGLIAVAMGLGSVDNPDSSYLARRDQAVMFVSSQGSRDVQPGQNFSVQLYENSGSQPINAVQGSIAYPADKLKLVAVKTDGDFPKEAATDMSTPGLVRVARSVNDANIVLQGLKKVVTLEFNVMPTAKGEATLTVNKDASLVVRSTDNLNVLSQTPSTTYKIK